MIRCPRCLAHLSSHVLTHYCAIAGKASMPPVTCDACGTPATPGAEGWQTFNPDHTRHVCPRCVCAGYIEACHA